MVTEVADGIHDITLDPEGLGRIRAFLVEDDVPTLFDAGFEHTRGALAAGVEAVGVEPERLVLTHGDPDHADGVDAAVEAFGVDVWAHEDETPIDAETEPDRRYADGDAIGRFEAVHVPGHTPGSCAFVDGGGGVAILGDTVFGSDFRGLPPGYLIAPSEHFSADIAAAERNLTRLVEFDFEVGLVYHGRNVETGASEKLEAYVNFHEG